MASELPNGAVAHEAAAEVPGPSQETVTSSKADVVASVGEVPKMKPFSWLYVLHLYSLNALC